MKTGGKIFIMLAILALIAVPFAACDDGAADWTDIEIPAGAQGPPGEDGSPGPPGRDGAQGPAGG